MESDKVLWSVGNISGLTGTPYASDTSLNASVKSDLISLEGKLYKFLGVTKSLVLINQFDLGCGYDWSSGAIHLNSGQIDVHAKHGALNKSIVGISTRQRATLKFALAHEYCHAFQQRFIDYGVYAQYSLVFELQADLIASWVLKNDVLSEVEVADFLVNVASTMQNQDSGAGYPTGCIRGIAVANGLLSPTWPVDESGAVKNAVGLFTNSLQRSFEMLFDKRYCDMDRGQCIACRGKVENRFYQGFDGSKLNYGDPKAFAIGIIELVKSARNFEQI